jgi:hypothetical protein
MINGILARGRQIFPCLPAQDEKDDTRIAAADCVGVSPRPSRRNCSSSEVARLTRRRIPTRVYPTLELRFSSLSVQAEALWTRLAD